MFAISIVYYDVALLLLPFTTILGFLFCDLGVERYSSVILLVYD